MAALRSLEPDDPASVTNGRPYILAHVEDHGERSRRLHFLLPDGSRPVTTIDVADDTAGLRHRLGMAYAAGRRRYNPRRSRRQPE